MTTKVPLQGTPGVLDLRDPTLLPNTDTPVASGGGTVDLESPATFDSNNPRVAAQITATIAGTVANGDSLTITITHGLFSGGSLAKTITAATGDTVSNLAEKFAAAFNDDAQCQEFGIEADAALGVVTFNWPGPFGNFAAFSRTINTGVETITFNPSGGGMTGGSGPIYAYNNFQYTFGGSILNFRAGQPFLADTPLLTALINDQMPVI
jgi:hypothetical protein